VVQEDGHRVRPTLDYDEKQRVQRANQIFLRLRKKLHDRDEGFEERDVREAAQGARWLREIVERYPGGLETAYKDALAASELPEEDQAFLRKRAEEARGFSSFVPLDLRKLEESAPSESKHPGSSTESTVPQDLMCGLVAGLLAGGTMMGNYFYFGFAVGMARKNDCW
jgi:hypothetical protein